MGFHIIWLLSHFTDRSYSQLVKGLGLVPSSHPILFFLVLEFTVFWIRIYFVLCCLVYITPMWTMNFFGTSSLLFSTMHVVQSREPCTWTLLNKYIIGREKYQIGQNKR